MMELKILYNKTCDFKNLLKIEKASIALNV